MTQLIEPSGVDPNSVSAATSRYRENQNIIYYGEQRFITYDLYIRKGYTKSGNEQSMVITKGIEYRPDLLSFDFYGFPDHWWKILEANGMKDVFEFKTGKTIFLPALGR
jgi:hypothetical protein